ncbi:MAG: dehydrogenase [Spirochaetes bacterium GWB1_36_13]|nr:MAG: dehydrogenase [Spirochaetes bacterium GWB1_36_13]
MLIRAKAPLRLGFAGGGTDVSPYSDQFGGAILNASINLYAYATIKPNAEEGKIILYSVDRNEKQILNAEEYLKIDGTLDLLKGVYNRIIKDFIKKPLSFELTTFVDAPAGSGLGTSSTLVVAILGAFSEWLGLPLGEYDVAHLAYEIERIDLDMAGGKQDQYAAAFGGFNFMEFYANDKVIVNPLRIKEDYINELNFNMLLYYTGTSRLSAKIIEVQANNVKQKKEKSIDAMHKLKEQSVMMKEAVLRGNIESIGQILDFGWKYKKQSAEEITNPLIDEIYESAIKNGATGGKISGAGGGGFMFFYCPKNTRYHVIDALQNFGGEFRRFNFEKKGVQTWKVKK